MTADHVDKPRLSRTHALDLLHGMVRVRQFEGKCAELYAQEKIRGFLHLYDGEDAVAVGVMFALRPADRVVSTYREHGHALARGVSMRVVLAEMLGKVEGCSRGRGGSMHIFDRSKNFCGGNAIVGGGLPIAVGFGLADRLRGETNVTLLFWGRRRGGRRVSRKLEPGCTLGAPCLVRVREQSLCNGYCA